MAPLKSCEGRRGGPEKKEDISEGFRRCVHLWFPNQILKFVGQTRRKLQVNIWSTDPKPCRTPTRHQQHLRSLRTCMQSRTRTLTQVPLQRRTGKTGNCGTPDWCHPWIFKPWLIRGKRPKKWYFELPLEQYPQLHLPIKQPRLQSSLDLFEIVFRQGSSIGQKSYGNTCRRLHFKSAEEIEKGVDSVASKRMFLLGITPVISGLTLLIPFITGVN